MMRFCKIGEDRCAGIFAGLYGVDDFPAAIDVIATGEDAGDIGSGRKQVCVVVSVDGNPASGMLQTFGFDQGLEGYLTRGFYDHVYFEG
jgi:hypothetical protein